MIYDLQVDWLHCHYDRPVQPVGQKSLLVTVNRSLLNYEVEVSWQLVMDVKSRWCLQSSSSSALVVPVTRCATLADRAVPVAAARAWNALPDFVTAVPTVSILHCDETSTELFDIVNTRDIFDCAYIVLIWSFLPFHIFFWLHVLD